MGFLLLKVAALCFSLQLVYAQPHDYGNEHQQHQPNQGGHEERRMGIPENAGGGGAGGGFQPPFGRRERGGGVHGLHGFTTIHMGGDAGQHGAASGSSAPEIPKLIPAIEVLSVSGCPRNSVPKRRTTACPIDGGVTLTIRGRGFPRNGISSIKLLHTKDRQMQLSCDHIRHSSMLPTLLLFCRLPAGAQGASYHMKLTTVQGVTLLARNVVEFQGKGLLSGDEDGEKGASGKDSSDGSGSNSGAGEAGGSTPIWDDYERLGIGGLKVQLEELFRRAFSSRLGVNQAIADRIGIRHIKGVILHGPPGTGKTLIARKVSKMLRAKSVQMVSGPEIMSKFVGESEKNLRALFSAAEADAEKNPENPGLHVIIMDEIDAIMRPRGGGDDTGARAVYDGVTTQMLAYMDGLKALNNLLIIGMTNRLGSLDKALLRPGRFEVQIRIPLPDDTGRQQIFQIHTKKLREYHYLDKDVSIPDLARKTAAMSGADISGVVRSAVSFAFERHQTDVAKFDADMAKAERPAQQPATTGDSSAEGLPRPPTFLVSNKDFDEAISEILSTKGSSINTAPFLERGIVLYNERFSALVERLMHYTIEMRLANTLKRMRVVLQGPAQSGTTAVAALIARASRFAYVNIITPESLVGMTLDQKLTAFQTAFDDAANVAHACIVLDRVEALIDFGPHKQPSVLAQQLGILLDRNQALVPYQQDSRLLVIITTSSPEAIRALSPTGYYDATETLKGLSHSDAMTVFTAYEVFETAVDTAEAALHLPKRIGVKQLLLLIDIARSRHQVFDGRKKLKAKDDLVSRLSTMKDKTDTDESSRSASTSAATDRVQDDAEKSNTAATTKAAEGKNSGATGTTGARKYLTASEFIKVLEEFGLSTSIGLADQSQNFQSTVLDL